jgi:Icc-related predicted phosphoesterase
MADPEPKRRVRVAAIADLHCPRFPSDVLQPIFTQAATSADVLLLGGDLTDRGLEDEARTLVKELASVKIPIVGVLGNHDFESGKAMEVTAILREAGIAVLDGDAVVVHGIGIAGTKGFGGGFGQRALQPWGEAIIKQFVHEAVAEALKLESALARLRTPTKLALLHYSPIPATVAGEPPEIYPFLGSSRLEEPLTRYEVSAVFHGHAHSGAPEGRTRADVPVYNCALPVLQRTAPQAPLRVVDVVTAAAEAAG